MSTKRITLLFATVALLTFSGCGEKKEHTEATGTAQKNAAAAQHPERFVLGDDKTRVEVKLTDKGLDFNVTEPVVMLDFFATWCPPCRAEIPHLADLQKRYEGKLKIIGVLVENKSTAAMHRFAQGHGINYLVSNAPDNMEVASAVTEMLQMPRNFSIPFMVLFVKGKYYRHYVGMVPEEMIESDIKEALQEGK